MGYYKKGGKKKAVDPYAKKDWYNIKAPSVFGVHDVEKTLVTRAQGTKVASKGLKHRVFEVLLADFQNNEDHFFRKNRLRAENVQGRNVLANLQNVFILKVKILKAPKFDLGRLMEVHGDYSKDVGGKVDRSAKDIATKPTEVVGA